MKKINKPVKDSIARNIPVIMQLEALECGAACLAMILAYYDKWIPLEQVRSDCGVSRDGSCAKNIILAGRLYGLEASGYTFEIEDFKEDGQYPCIIHWNFDHFVVLKGFSKNYAYINDPAVGEIKVTLKEFDGSFTGICLLFKPGQQFKPSGKRKSSYDYIKQRSKGLMPAIVFVLLTTIISGLLAVIRPAFTRVFYDVLLVGKNPSWITPFLISLTVFSFVQLLVLFLTTIYNLKINGKLTAIGSTSFMWQVLRLPMEFFSQRMTGDILSREKSNAVISNTIVNTLVPLIINSFMMIFYFIVMVRYNWVLTLIALLTTLINALVNNYTSKSRINSSRIQIRDASKLEAVVLGMIESIEIIKSTSAEEGVFKKFAGLQASANNGLTEYNKTTNYLNLANTLLSNICSTIIITIGIYLTIKGQFTLGMITAFQGYLANFLAPVSSLIDGLNTLHQMQTQMDRIDDVMEYPIDSLFDNSNNLPLENYKKLSGAIEMKHVSFGYGKLAQPLIKDFSLSIKAGQKIALVGASGCGKSTIAKLICGVNKPFSGQISFDGKLISQIDRNVFTGSVAMVDQDVVLFEDSIKNNIKMWDESIADFEVVMACRDCQIHNDILARDNGYDYLLAEGGKDFSGGQRQLMEIARVLAQDPTLCILDEATSALDSDTEYQIIKAIENRGITCIVIAHRLSTIRDCDEIIVLDHGNIVERGTHEQLMALDGYYTKLITND